MFKKKYHPSFGLAGPDPHDDGDFPVGAILEAEITLPNQYIVSRYRHWFNDDFEADKTIIAKEIKNQDGRSSCVSQAYSRQKEAQEKKPLSARMHHAFCKLIDNYTGQGTYLRTAMKVGVDTGICDEELHPEPDGKMSYTEYIDVHKISEQALNNANRHKSSSYFSIKSYEEIKQTMFQYDTPIVTGCDWTNKDNKIGKDGIFPSASGTKIDGHAFAPIGWIKIKNKEYLVVVNSWGVYWGHCGLFFIPQSQIQRLYFSWMTIDMPRNVAEIVQKYHNKNIKGADSQHLYFVTGGKKRHYADELVWWSHGNLFAGGFLTADPEEVELIPDGEKMEFNYKTEWSAAQIKELLVLLHTNSKRADELKKRYFD